MRKLSRTFRSAFVSACSSPTKHLHTTLRPIGARPFKRTLCAVVVTLALANGANATSTEAHAYASIQGTDQVVKDAYGDSSGAQTSADSVSGDGSSGLAAAHGEAGASVGSLRVSTSARASVGTDVGAQAGASWSDGFVFASQGHASGEQGSFTAGVTVQGGLLAQASALSTGYSYGDTYVVARFSLNPNTGFNGGLHAAQGGGRQFIDSRGLGFSSGQEAFDIVFDDVPFTFGRNISIALSLTAVSGTRTFNESSARAEADYGHTMRWAGVTNVRDASGNQVNAFTAVSPESNFDFAAVTPVPEPSLIAMLWVGAAFVLSYVRQGKRLSSRSSI